MRNLPLIAYSEGMSRIVLTADGIEAEVSPSTDAMGNFSYCNFKDLRSNDDDSFVAPMSVARNMVLSYESRIENLADAVAQRDSRIVEVEIDSTHIMSVVYDLQCKAEEKQAEIDRLYGLLHGRSADHERTDTVPQPPVSIEVVSEDCQAA